MAPRTGRMACLQLSRALTLFALFLVSSASFLTAATWYVDGANPSCTNSGPSAGLPASPYCSISPASTAKGGHDVTLIVLPAIYREQVTVGASGAARDTICYSASATTKRRLSGFSTIPPCPSRILKRNAICGG